MKSSLPALASLLLLVASPVAAQSGLPNIFTTGYERVSRADCPDVQGGAQAETPDDTYGCWAGLADSRPFNGSWLDVRVKPVFALVYVNGRYVGTAEQFTAPFRPLRIGLGPQRIEFRAPGYRNLSFWVIGNTAKITTATGALTKKP
jgi:hypothetical protein